MTSVTGRSSRPNSPEPTRRRGSPILQVVARRRTGSREHHRQRAFRTGRDWAEVIASRVGAELGVPLAETRLCLRDGRRGSLSRDVRQAQYDLVGGHLALEDCRSVTDYFPHFEREPAVDPNRPDVRRPGHSLSNIRRALADCEPPPEFSGPVEMDAFDVFAGYSLFDVVANRDRHEENWSVLRPRLRDRSPLLCPSYDHSSSLGFAETPEKLRRRSAGSRA